MLVVEKLRTMKSEFYSIATAEIDVLGEWKYVAFLGNFADAKDEAQNQTTWVLADDEP
jgi:hypothetical protein